MTKQIFSVMASVALALGLSGCAERQDERQERISTGGVAAVVDISAVKADLEALSGARILLGHQSVGRNVLAGVESLAAEAGVSLRILEIDGAPPDPLPGLFHSAIGTNGDPDSKCEMFERLLDRPEKPAYDLAMMKFCYVDLGRGTPLETAAMLERYATLVEKLRASRPDVRLVHITLPLRSTPVGKRVTLERLLGREIEEDADNALRNAFNAGLRERFGAEPLFDLAKLESTRPDGSSSTVSHRGKTVYVLAHEYTDDGGHLNPDGQRRAAAAFLRTLATALRQRSERV